MSDLKHKVNLKSELSREEELFLIDLGLQKLLEDVLKARREVAPPDSTQILSAWAKRRQREQARDAAAGKNGAGPQYGVEPKKRVYRKGKKGGPRNYKWTPEHRANFLKTMAAKKAAQK